MSFDYDTAIYRVAYISRCLVHMADLDLADLQRRAARTNERNNVTGLLLFDGVRFIQAIEGEKVKVEATMRRIAEDKRHDRLDYINRGPANQRRFEDWSMLCKRVGPGVQNRDFLDAIVSRMLTVQDPNLQAAFIGFAKMGSDMPKQSNRYLGPRA
jgi:hypothetical protein